MTSPAGAPVHVKVADQPAAARAGVTGLLFTVDTGSAAGTLSVGVDYTSFRNAVGGNWANRLHLARLPACALTTPAVPACRTQTPIRSSNDTTAGIVSGSVDLPAPHATGSTSSSDSLLVMAAVAGTSGSNGSFAASSLAPSGTWSVSGASGAFTWSYPIQVPPVASGTVAPTVTLSYNSSSVDGRIASTNNQPSWIGEGWEYSPGFIERTYRTCRDDPAGTAPKTDDLCWSGQIVTANFNGQSTPLVRDDATGTWHGKNDDGERIELLTGAANGAHDGEYWKLTTLDGTQYFFGRERGPGWTNQATTNATWTVPVYGAHPGDPCNDPAGFASSSCPQAWRWNLDYVEDTHGNTTIYYYDKETNYYGPNGSTTGVPYIRGGTLARIDYGLRDENGTVYANPAPDQVVFDTAERCIPSDTFSCDPSLFTAANASHWPDTPQDLQCTAGTTCDVHGPSFWSTRRLTTITTQYHNGSGYTKVDSYALGQEFPTAGDPELWLNSITRTGYTPAGAAITLPPVTFAGQLLDNRVDGYNSQPPMTHWRLTRIDTETGSSIGVTYSQRECTATNVPADPAHNSMRCFPVYWTLPFTTDPILDYFHKYVTTQVDVQDRNALSPTQRTSYTYVGTPAWHYDDNEVVKPANRTWGQFRGYGEVDVRTGDPNHSLDGIPDRLTFTATTYYRGMDGDVLPGGAHRSATVGDSLGETVADSDAFADGVLEVRTFDGPGGTQLATTITDATVVATTGSRARSGLPALVASIVATSRQRTLVDLATGGVRTTTATYGYDSLGRQVQRTDTGDGVPDLCTTTTYADNTTAWIRDRVAETITSQQTCPPVGTAPSPVLSDVRTYYDGQTTLGTVTGAGDPTRVDTATDDTGGTLHFAKTTATFDASGRPASTTVYTSPTDTTGRTTRLAYTPADGGSLTQVVTTNAKAQTTTTVLDPGRGSTLTSIDVSGYRTDARYDALGRVTAVWLPNHAIATQDPSATYSYLLRTSGPLAVTTRTLIDYGAGTNYATTVTLYDAFGQLRQTQTDAEGGGRVVADTFYDSHGWVQRTNNRWFTTGAPDTTLISTADSAIDDRTITRYDGLGRAVLATEYKGLTATWSTQTIYGGDRTTVIPPTGGITSTTIDDARGHTTELRQYTSPPTVNGNTVTGGTYQATTYHHTPLGLQDTVTGPDGQTRTSTFDLAGRTLTQTDPDTGTSTYTYDDAGDLTTISDARGNTLAFTYDELGRKTAEYAGSTSGTKLASWTWDTLKKGKLSFTTRFTPNGNYLVGVKGYDGMGNPTGSVIQIPTSETGLGGLYTTMFGWTSTGLLHFVEPASGGGLPGELIGTTYTPLGHPVDTAGYNAYAEATTYTPYGEPQQIHLGDSASHATLTYDRDAQTRRITNVNLSAPTPSPLVDNTAYTYDPAGNITRTVDTQGDTGTTRTSCYRYDALDRLTEAWTATDNCTATPSTANVGGPNPYWTTWTFTASGQRDTQIQHALPGQTGGDTTTTYTYGTSSGTQPDTLTSTSTTGPAGTTTTAYTYDPAGNTTTRTLPGGTQTLAWDAENRLAAYTTPAGSGDYVYDADGNQLIRHDPDSTTLYLPGQELTRRSDGTITGTRYYTHGGTTVALRVGGANPQYLLADPHGTTQLAVTPLTYTVTRRTFDPYGNPLGTTTGGTWPDNHGFLNKPVNTTTGLTDIGARKYDPTTGQFISPDPLLATADPQSLNGYSYADNNPATNSDPTGELCNNGPDGASCYNPNTGTHTKLGGGQTSPAEGPKAYVTPGGTVIGPNDDGNTEIYRDSRIRYELPPNAPKDLHKLGQIFDLWADRFELAGWDLNPAHILEVACEYGNMDFCGEAFVQVLQGDGKAIDDGVEPQHKGLFEADWKEDAPTVGAGVGMSAVPAGKWLKDWSKNSIPRSGLKGLLKDAKLPTTGKIRFVPPENTSINSGLQKGPRGGYIDRFGNEWVKGPSRTRGQDFEWDVQLSRTGRAQLGRYSRDGAHINVSLDGRITHR